MGTITISTVTKYKILWLGRQADKILLFKKILKSCNFPSNLFFECLNRFLALLTLFQ